MSPNEKLAHVDEDVALEEGFPDERFHDNGAVPSNNKTRVKLPERGRLSVVSQKYDMDGDGVLNEAEQAMRDMDKSGRGFLTNDKVYQIVQQQMAMQEQMFNMKRILIGLSVFTVILALSNLGTAWAAAVLAKETTVDKGGTMHTKDGQHTVGTRAEVDMYEATKITDEEKRRELNLFAQTGIDGDVVEVSDTIEAQVDADTGCQNVVVRIKYSHCSDGATRFYDYQCSGASSSNAGGGTHTDGTVTVDSCKQGKCDVTGLPCPAEGTAAVVARKPDDSSCFDPEECQSGLCHGGDGSTTEGTCVPACGANPGGFANALCDSNTITGTCEAHPYCCHDSTVTYTTFCDCDGSTGTYVCYSYRRLGEALPAPGEAIPPEGDEAMPAQEAPCTWQYDSGTETCVEVTTTPPPVVVSSTTPKV